MFDNLTPLWSCQYQIEEVTVSKMCNCFIYFSLKIRLIEVKKITKIFSM